MFCGNWKHRQAPPSQTEQTDRPPFPEISNTHTKWDDATPFPTGLRRESGGKVVGWLVE